MSKFPPIGKSHEAMKKRKIEMKKEEDLKHKKRKKSNTVSFVKTEMNLDTMDLVTIMIN